VVNAQDCSQSGKYAERLRNYLREEKYNLGDLTLRKKPEGEKWNPKKFHIWSGGQLWGKKWEKGNPKKTLALLF